jgi:hypothetical protein
MRDLPLGLLLLVSMVAGCKKPPLPGTDGLDLATSTSAAPAPEAKGYTDHVVAYSGARGLVLDDKVLSGPATASMGFDAKVKRSGPNDYFLLPLEAELKAKHGTAALVALEGSTPFRTAAEILYTLGQTGYATFDLLVQSRSGQRHVLSLSSPRSGGPSCLALAPDAVARLAAEMQGAFEGGPPPPPAPPRVPLADRPALCLAFVVSTAGITVSSGGDKLDATCLAFAPEGPKAPTFAGAAGEVPMADVTRCAAALKARFPAATTGQVVVSGARETPWRDVVGLLDAAAALGDPVLGVSN